jgi:hypothetical protein
LSFDLSKDLLHFKTVQRHEQCLGIDSISSALRRPSDTIAATSTPFQWLLEKHQLRTAECLVFGETMECTGPLAEGHTLII